LRYLAGLANAIVARKGRIYTSTHAAKFEGGNKGTSGRVETKDGHVVTARDSRRRHEHPRAGSADDPHQAVSVSHLRHRGARPAGAVVPALYWDTPSPYHYVRLEHDAEGDLLIVGGEDHKTGQAEDGEARYERLIAWARERFPAPR
jgi:hypothetical protein